MLSRRAFVEVLKCLRLYSTEEPVSWQGFGFKHELQTVEHGGDTVSIVDCTQLAAVGLMKGR
jgi:hypothetical protein